MMPLAEALRTPKEGLGVAATFCLCTAQSLFTKLTRETFRKGTRVRFKASVLLALSANRASSSFFGRYIGLRVGGYQGFSDSFRRCLLGNPFTAFLNICIPCGMKGVLREPLRRSTDHKI